MTRGGLLAEIRFARDDGEVRDERHSVEIRITAWREGQNRPGAPDVGITCGVDQFTSRKAPDVYWKQTRSDPVAHSYVPTFTHPSKIMRFMDESQGMALPAASRRRMAPCPVTTTETGLSASASAGNSVKLAAIPSMAAATRGSMRG